MNLRAERSNQKKWFIGFALFVSILMLAPVLTDVMGNLPYLTNFVSQVSPVTSSAQGVGYQPLGNVVATGSGSEVNANTLTCTISSPVENAGDTIVFLASIQNGYNTSDVSDNYGNIYYNWAGINSEFFELTPTQAVVGAWGVTGQSPEYPLTISISVVSANLQSNQQYENYLHQNTTVPANQYGWSECYVLYGHPAIVNANGALSGVSNCFSMDGVQCYAVGGVGPYNLLGGISTCQTPVIGSYSGCDTWASEISASDFFSIGQGLVFNSTYWGPSPDDPTAANTPSNTAGPWFNVTQPILYNGSSDLISYSNQVAECFETACYSGWNNQNQMNLSTSMNVVQSDWLNDGYCAPNASNCVGYGVDASGGSYPSYCVNPADSFFAECGQVGAGSPGPFFVSVPPFYVGEVGYDGDYLQSQQMSVTLGFYITQQPLPPACQSTIQQLGSGSALYCGSTSTDAQIIQTGDLIVVSAFSTNSLPTGISDTAGDSFQQVSVVSDGNAPAQGNQEMWIATALSGGIFNFTVDYGAVQNASEIQVTSYHQYGEHTAWNIVQETHFTENGAPACQTGSTINPSTGDAVITTCSIITDGGNTTLTAGSPYVLSGQLVGNPIGQEDEFLTMATQAALNWDTSNNPTNGAFGGSPSGLYYQNIIDVQEVNVPWTAGQSSPAELANITTEQTSSFGTTSASCTLTNLYEGDTVVVGYAYQDYSAPQNTPPQFFISDNNHYTWQAYGSAIEQTEYSPGIYPVEASTVWVSTPLVADSPTDTISVVVQNGVNPVAFMDCRVLVGVNVNLIPSGDTYASGGANFNANSPTFFLSQPMNSAPAAVYSILASSDTTATGSGGYLVNAGAGFQMLRGNATSSGDSILSVYAEGEVVTPAFEQNTPFIRNESIAQNSEYGSALSSVAIPLVQTKLVSLTQTTTEEATTIQSETYTYSGQGFNVANATSYIPVRFETNLVYIWYNAADYPVTISSLSIPILNTGGNDSLLILGIYDTGSISAKANVTTTPFTLEGVQTFYLQSGAVLQNITWNAGLNIAPNSYYSVAVMDANASLQCESQQLTTSTGVTVTGGTTQISVTQFYHGGVYTRTLVVSGTTTTTTEVGYLNAIVPCAVSPATYFGIMNFTDGSGYVGAGFINSNITGNNPQTVMPNFFTPNMILSTNSPLPDMSIVEVDQFQQVITLTQTATYTAGQTNGASYKIFDANGGQVIELLLLMNLPVAFVGIGILRKFPMDGRVLGLVSIATVILVDALLEYVKTPSGQPLLATPYIVIQLLVLAVVFMRKRGAT